MPAGVSGGADETRKSVQHEVQNHARSCLVDGNNKAGGHPTLPRSPYIDETQSRQEDALSDVVFGGMSAPRRNGRTGRFRE